MKQKSLSLWLKLIITGTGICGLFIYVFIIPMLGQAIAAAENGAFDYCYHPWLFFIWMTGIPCYAGLVFAWRIAGNIGTIVLLSLVVVFAGIAASVASAALSHLVMKAADLQNQSDLTI